MDGSYGMTPRPDGRLHVVMWEPGPFPIFVAFDAAAAKEFGDRVDEEHQCCVTGVEELALIDNYGFHVPRSAAAIVAPWLAEASPDLIHHYLTWQG